MGQFLGQKDGFVVPSHSLNCMMRCQKGLDDNLSTSPRRTGEIDRIEKRVIGTFGGSEIRQAESRVRLYNSNETHRRERPTPQCQLCSDNDIAFPLLNPAPEDLGLCRFPHGISIEPNHCRMGKQSSHIFFHPLRALPNQPHARTGAGSAGLGNRYSATAVGTEQTSCLPRIHQRHATGRTPRNMTTVTTDEGAGIALPVEKQQNASPTTER